MFVQEVGAARDLLAVQVATPYQVNSACNQLSFNNGGIPLGLVDRLDRGEGGSHGRTDEQGRLLGVEQSLGLVALCLHAEVVGLAGVVFNRDVQGKS